MVTMSTFPGNIRPGNVKKTSGVQRIHRSRNLNDWTGRGGRVGGGGDDGEFSTTVGAEMILWSCKQDFLISGTCYVTV